MKPEAPVPWGGRGTGGGDTHTKKYGLGNLSEEKGVRKQDAQKPDIEGMSCVLSLAGKRAVTQRFSYYQPNLWTGERKGERYLTFAAGETRAPRAPGPGARQPVSGQGRLGGHGGAFPK